MKHMAKYLQQAKRVAAVMGLVLSVTVGGVTAGALLVSPLAASNPWVLPTVAVVAIIAVTAMLRVWLWPAAERTTMRRFARHSLRGSERAATRLAASLPSMSLRAVDGTPKHVHALAAAGSTLVEIARRTRLPVDAVSMLLSISGASRQLQPPTA